MGLVPCGSVALVILLAVKIGSTAPRSSIIAHSLEVACKNVVRTVVLLGRVKRKLGQSQYWMLLHRSLAADHQVPEAGAGAGDDSQGEGHPDPGEAYEDRALRRARAQPPQGGLP